MVVSFSLSLSMAYSKQNFNSLHMHILKRRIFPQISILKVTLSSMDVSEDRFMNQVDL